MCEAVLDVSPWGSSRFILIDRMDKAIIVQESKLVHCLLPIPGCPSPIGGDIAQGQADQLACRFITREVPARFDDLA